jgi:hypothetical protein
VTITSNRDHAVARNRAWHWHRVRALPYPEFLAEYQVARHSATVAMANPAIAPRRGRHPHVVHFRMLEADMRRRLGVRRDRRG